MKKKRILLGLGAFAVLGLTTVLASCAGEKTYTVKFYNGDTEVSSQTVTGGFNAEVPTAPTKEGSVFNGWYADETLTTPFDFGQIIEGDTSVYAAWVNEFAVVFKDGTKTLSTQTIVSGYNAKVPTAPTKEGYVFNGWYADAACTKEFKFGSIITAATTIYAGWIAQYNVTFKDGSRTLSTTTLNAGSLVEAPADLESEEKEFAGWYADAALTTPYNFGTPISADTVIYAKWDTLYHNVTLYSDANTVIETIAVEHGDTISLEQTPTRKYKKFNGKWYTDANCENQFVTSTEITEPISLYAGWDDVKELVEYKFNYNAMLAKYGTNTKTTEIEKVGPFYLENGQYFETKYSNTTNSQLTNDPDFNTQKKCFWFNVNANGVLSFDYKDRGSSTKFTIYRIDTVTDNSVVPTYTDEDIIFNKKISEYTSPMTATHFEYTLDEAGTYVVLCDGSAMIQQLKFTDYVGVAAPESITVSGGKDQYLVGESFDSSTAQVTLHFANGREDLIATGYTFDGDYNMNKEGVYTINVEYTYEDKDGDKFTFETSYDINVYDVDSIKAYTFGLDSSRNTKHDKLVYAVESDANSATKAVDASNVYVHATGKIGEDNSYTKLLDSSAWTLSTIDATTVGRKKVTVTYGETTVVDTFDVEVVDKLFDDQSDVVYVYADASLTQAKKVTYGSDANPAYTDYTTDATATYAFPSITEALQYLDLCEVSKDATKYVVVMDGTYNEKVFVDMPNVNIVGATRDETNVGSNSGAIITFNAMNGINAPNGANYSTDGAASFTISNKATNCFVYNVTISNYYNTHALYQESLKITSSTQATACLVRGDMAKFVNVTFSGYHDTLYSDNGRQYYDNCYIEGRTDYIFGDDATAYFTDCTIKTLGAGLTEKNGGYVVATKGGSGITYGYIFDGCRFIADDQTQNGCVSIARGWEGNMTVMVMNSELGAHISKGTYGQTYYEKAFTEDTFTAALEIGVFTYDANNTEKPYTKLAKTAEFDANATYFIQLNDRYTKMNADPVASKLFEYNNTGAGAIAYSENDATKYAAKTFTLMNDATQAAKYADMNTIFAASNNGYDYNWNPVANEITLTVHYSLYDGTEQTFVYGGNLYVNNTLTTKQLDEIEAYIDSKIDSEKQVISGLYIDEELTVELSNETKLTSTTEIFAQIKNAKITEKTFAYSKAEGSTNEGWKESGLSTSSYNILSPTAGLEVIKSDGKGAISKEAKTYDGGIKAYWLSSGDDKYIESPKITDSGVKEVQVSLYCGTSDTSNAHTIKITAYNAANEAIGYSLASTPGDSNTLGKKSGYASKSKNGSTTEEFITVKASGDISYFRISMTGEKYGTTNTEAKSYAIAKINAKYNVIKFEDSTAVAAQSYSITFGSEGNYKTSNKIDVTGATITDHNSELTTSNVQGDLKLNVKAGGVVVVYGYPTYYGYSIKVGNNDAITATKECTYVKVTEDSEVVISSSNHLYEIDVIYPLNKNTTVTYSNKTFAGKGIAFQYVDRKTADDNGTSLHFKNDNYSSVVFTVLKAGTVVITGHDSQYSVLDIYKNGELVQNPTKSDASYTLEVAAGDYIAVTGNTLEQGYSYLKSITYTMKVEQPANLPTAHNSSLDISTLVPTKDKAKLDGTEAKLNTANSFLTVGDNTKVTVRTKSSSDLTPTCIENIADNLSVTFTGTGTLTIAFASTGNSGENSAGDAYVGNVSALGIKNSSGNYLSAKEVGSGATLIVANSTFNDCGTDNNITGSNKKVTVQKTWTESEAGAYYVSGTTYVTLTYEITEPGTYTISCPNVTTTRGARINAITMVDNY